MDKDRFAPFKTGLAELETFDDGPPHELYERMRDEAPIIWTAAPSDWPEVDQPGFWSTTRAKHVAQVSRDPKTYSSWLGGFAMRSEEVGSLEVARTAMIGKDGEDHRRMRGTVSLAFTLNRVQSLEPSISRTVSRVFDAAFERGEVDLATDMAGVVANTTMADLLGIPEEDRARLNQWTDAFLSADDAIAGGMRGDEAMAAISEYFQELLVERDAHPSDDLVTALSAATYEGEPMPRDEQVGVFAQLIAAGIDSTKNTICNGVVTLLEHPDQLDLLRDEPTLVPSAVEEILRWRPPFSHQRRTTSCATELGGQKLGPGESVVMWLQSSSRDPQAIERPDVFDVTRGPKNCPHHAFGGGGRHFCLGASLARLELVTFFHAFVTRVANAELTGTPRRIRSRFVDGYTHVPIALKPHGRKARG
ncbi:MAG: cytochrome P450 [Parasphingopyxis sp.]|uniref:cytochrome P450 n=1 Tax=Parasphingopyxis sp. TaxID=1920299 RepID=UPI003FA10672